MITNNKSMYYLKVHALYTYGMEILFFQPKVLLELKQGKKATC